MGGNLFRLGDGKGSKMAQAAQEAVRLKKAAGAVRYLWRNAKTNSHDAVVQEMKDLLRQSPRREEAQDGDEEEGDEAVEGSDVAEEHAPRAIVAAHEPADESSSSDGDASEVAPPEGVLLKREPDEDEECDQSQSSMETDSLNATTLRLGEGIDSDVEEFPDSQVKTGCGWLGQFYAKGDPEKPDPDNQACAKGLLRDVKMNLEEDKDVSGPLGLQWLCNVSRSRLKGLRELSVLFFNGSTSATGHGMPWCTCSNTFCPYI